MSALVNSKLLGAALIVVALGVDLTLTLTGHPVPSLIASVVTAGLGLVTGSILSSSKAPAVAATAAAEVETVEPDDDNTPSAS
jgi:hypothetical protein